jgi:hypothetical protein
MDMLHTVARALNRSWDASPAEWHPDVPVLGAPLGPLGHASAGLLSTLVAQLTRHMQHHHGEEAPRLSRAMVSTTRHSSAPQCTVHAMKEREVCRMPPGDESTQAGHRTQRHSNL